MVKRYPTDLTDPEWAILAPFIPPTKAGGRPRTTDMREVVNAIVYVLRSGCQWRMLPKDFPPYQTRAYRSGGNLTFRLEYPHPLLVTPAGGLPP